MKACGELALAALLGGVVLNGAVDRVGALDGRLVILVVNLAIVWFLAAQAARRRRTRRPDAIT